MRVNDITNKQSLFVRMAKAAGAAYPEDVVQDFYIQLLEIQLAEGSIDRLLYGQEDINLFYCYKAIRGLAVDQLRVEQRYVQLTSKEYNIATTEVEVEPYLLDRLHILNSSEVELLLDYLFSVYSVKQLSVQRGCSVSSLYERIKYIKQKLRNTY